MIHSFLLIGQSNAGGRGFANEVPPIPKENLYVLRNGRWRPMYVPVNPDRVTSGICLAESFAQRYAKEKGVDHMWTYGERAKHICRGYGEGALNFATKQELGEYIIANLEKGDSIVFKASHSMRFEDILEQVYKAQE